VLVRPLFALLVMVVAMDVVVVLVLPLAVPLAVPLVVLLAVPDGAPVLAEAPAPVAVTTAVAMAVALEVALAQPCGGAQQPPLAYNTAAQFLEMWNNCATDVARQHLEQQAISRSLVAEVQIAAMVKINLRLQVTVGALTGQVGVAQAAAAAANQAAANAQAVATAARNTDRFRPAAPPKYGNKKKDAEVKQWLPIIQDYLRTAPNADYIQLASSYLEGGLPGYPGEQLWTPGPGAEVLGYLERPQAGNPGYWRVHHRVPAGPYGLGWLGHG
jgi:hypothetical protein